MSGSLAQQIGLLSTLKHWKRAQGAADLCNPPVPDQQAKADTLHLQLTSLAIHCGFRPHAEHRGMSTVQFAEERRAVMERVFPNNLKERDQ